MRFSASRFPLPEGMFTCVYSHRTQKLIVNPLRTAVLFWGQTTQFSSSLSPKRDCGSKGVKGERKLVVLLGVRDSERNKNDDYGAVKTVHEQTVSSERSEPVDDALARCDSLDCSKSRRNLLLPKNHPNDRCCQRPFFVTKFCL